MVDEGVSRTRLVIAFAALYFIWGSTYLGIRFAIETIPPFLMAGTRLMLAGVPLFIWSVWRTGEWPRPVQWTQAAVVGGFLFLGGHGALTWSVQFVPTGTAALLISTIPLWMTLLDSIRPGGAALTLKTVGGLSVGFLGVGLLIGPETILGGSRPDVVGAVVLMVGAFSWAVGSIFSKMINRLPSPMLSASMHLLSGGMLLWLLGLATGEAGRFDPGAVSTRSALSLFYLAFVGSLVAFSAFTWLLRVTTPARTSTYAYVNPMVAVLIGWAFGGEAMIPRVLAGGVLIISAVVLIMAPPRAGAKSTETTPREPQLSAGSGKYASPGPDKYPRTGSGLREPEKEVP